MTLSCSRSTGSITTSVKVLAEAVARVLLAVEVDDLPAQTVKLIEQRLLDVVAFVEFDVLGCFVLTHQAFPFLHQLLTSGGQTVFLVAGPGCVGLGHFDQSRSEGRMKVILAEGGSMGKPQFGHEIGRAALRFPQSAEQTHYLVALEGRLFNGLQQWRCGPPVFPEAATALFRRLPP